MNLVAAMEALDEPEGLFKDNKSSNSANGRSKFRPFGLIFLPVIWVLYYGSFEWFFFFLTFSLGFFVGVEDAKAPAWKKLNSTELGITTSMIDKPTRKVLNGLKRKGTC